MPAVVPETGPFAGTRAVWVGDEPPLRSGQRSAAVGFYLALVTSYCLKLIGHEGPVIVEGPFARNSAYLLMLGTASHSPIIPTASATGTSQGAALLVAPDSSLQNQLSALPEPDKRMSEALSHYSAKWVRDLAKA